MGTRLIEVATGVIAASVAIASCHSEVVVTGSQPATTASGAATTSGPTTSASSGQGGGSTSSSTAATTSSGPGGSGGAGGQPAATLFGVPIADAQPVDVAIDGAGNIVIVGSLTKAVDFGSGPLVPKSTDAFVLELAPEGTLSWAKPWGDDRDEQVAAVAVDAAGNIGITGRRLECKTGPNGKECLEAFFAAKLTDSGSTVWVHDADGQPPMQGSSAGARRGNDIAFDAAGNIVVAATVGLQDDLGGGPLPGKGPLNAALVKYDSAGSDLWSKVFGDGWSKFGSKVAIDGAGAIVLLVHSKSGETDFGGGAIANKGVWDPLVARFAPDGAHLWSKNLGGADWDHWYGFDVAPSGSFAATGTGKLDFGGGQVSNYVAGFDVQGQFQFSHDAMFGRALDVDASGNTFVHECQQQGLVCKPGSSKLGRVTTMGTSWSVALPDELLPVAIAADNAGVVAVGTFSGSIDLGDGPQKCAGSSCMLVLRVAPP